MKSKTMYNGNTAANIEYDPEYQAWLVSISMAIGDPNGKAQPREIIQAALEEVEALLKSLG